MNKDPIFITAYQACERSTMGKTDRYWRFRMNQDGLACYVTLFKFRTELSIKQRDAEQHTAADRLLYSSHFG